MAEAIVSKTDINKTIEKEEIMSHIEYDVNNRPEYIYTAPINALNGSPCIATKYTYDGVSTRVVNFREFKTTWNSAWTITVP